MKASRLTNLNLQASVIIPTYNRREQLRLGLEALARQDLPMDQFEVIVVADGCSDGTAGMARAFGNQILVQVLEQPAQGPGAARNLGARQAQAPRLIFMDDDIVAVPGFIRAHLEAAQPDPERVVIGYLPPYLGEQTSFFRLELFDWWEANFARMRKVGHRFRYSDLTSGNFSISARLFWEVGGFLPEFRCHEDYELGVRLMRLGVDFVFSDAACGEHYEGSNLQRALQRKFDEGAADVRMGRLYPELRTTFLMWRLERYSLLPSRIMKNLAFSSPALAQVLSAALHPVLALLDRLGLYRSWQRVLYGLLGSWYWRGVAQELGSLSAYKEYLPGPGPVPAAAWMEIDLDEGMEQAEVRLDEQRPEGLRFYFKGIPAGIVPPQPGSERLAARHLRPLLVRTLSAPLLRAMASTPDIVYPEVRARLTALCDAEMRLNPPETAHE